MRFQIQNQPNAFSGVKEAFRLCWLAKQSRELDFRIMNFRTKTSVCINLINILVNQRHLVMSSWSKQDTVDERLSLVATQHS